MISLEWCFSSGKLVTGDFVGIQLVFLALVVHLINFDLVKAYNLSFNCMQMFISLLEFQNVSS